MGSNLANVFVENFNSPSNKGGLCSIPQATKVDLFNSPSNKGESRKLGPQGSRLPNLSRFKFAIKSADYQNEFCLQQKS